MTYRLNDSHMAVDMTTFRRMLFCTFRYALGRRTVIVAECRGWLEAHWDVLTGIDQQQIKREITDAIKLQMAGDECDVEQWQRVLNLPVKEDQISTHA